MDAEEGGSESDFARVRKLVQTDPYMKSWYERLYLYCNDLLSQDLLTQDFSTSNPSLGTATTQRVLWCAMVWHISGERVFAERAVQELLNACTYTNWNPSSYLDTASMCFAVGLGYDWLYHFMTETQRTTVREGIYRLGLSTLENPTDTIKQRLTENHNWNPWCNGGVSVAAAAVFENYPELCARIISNAVSNVQLSMRYDGNGAYPEGPDYSICGLSFTVYLLDTLDSVLGTDFGLSDLEGMKETGKYLLAVNGYRKTFNFGDGTDSFKDCGILHWYASRYNLPELSVHQRNYQTTNIYCDEYLTMLWYDPELVEGVQWEDKQLDYLLYSDEAHESVASFRSFYGDEHQVYAAIKSGANLTAHSDMDIGTFVMEALGEVWFADLGKENYNIGGYFDRFTDDGRRWTYYRTRAEGQNTIVVNPDASGGQSVEAECQIEDYVSAYDGGYAAVNMTDAYDDFYGVTSAKRTLTLFDNRTRVQLNDEITCSKSSTIYWFAHTQADISISSDGKTATLTLNGKTLLAQIAGPSAAKFTTMSAAPLSTSPNPSGQNANSGYRKLVIKLTNTTSANISVVFTPIATESDKSKTVPTGAVTLASYKPGTAVQEGPTDVYKIYTADQLFRVAEWVKEGKAFTGETIQLMNDIDMKGRTFMPIGGCGSGKNFSGTFDGQNHVIKNLLVFEPDNTKVGFFGAVSAAKIRNLGIESGFIFGSEIAGGITGEARDGTVISNCFNRATVVTTTQRSGGLIGQVAQNCAVTIQNSYNNSIVRSKGNTAGGLVGYLANACTLTIENSYHVGKLTDASGQIGLVGYHRTSGTNAVTKLTLKNCRSTAALKSSLVADSTTLEDFSGSKVVTQAQMVSAAVELGSAFIYDCEWENNGYPVLAWQCDTTLPENLELSTAAQLRLLAYNVNAGISNYSGKTVRLTRDIDLDNREWTPIGGNNSTYILTGEENEDLSGAAFEGTFDGQGYAIRDMRITSRNHYVGFFGNIDPQMIEAMQGCSNHVPSYIDNGEDHSVVCETCGTSTEPHSFENGLCICGAKDKSTPVKDENLTFNMSISVGSEMQVVYTIMNAKVQNFKSLYLEVTKEVANGDSVTTKFSLDAENMIAIAHPTTGAVAGYQAIYTGIFASEMGDNFTATLYAVASDGTIYYGESVTSSIKTYLLERIADSKSSSELKTLAVDMLNYGAAAQLYFGYNVENLANSDLTEEQNALATQELPDAVNSIAVSGTGCNISTSTSLQSKVLLYLTCLYASDENSNMRFVIKDADGKLLGEATMTMQTEKACH